MRGRRKRSEEDRERRQDLIQSDPKGRREGEKVVPSKESPVKPSGGLQTQVDPGLLGGVCAGICDAP